MYRKNKKIVAVSSETSGLLLAAVSKYLDVRRPVLQVFDGEFYNPSSLAILQS